MTLLKITSQPRSQSLLLRYYAYKSSNYYQSSALVYLDVRNSLSSSISLKLLSIISTGVPGCQKLSSQFNQLEIIINQSVLVYLDVRNSLPSSISLKLLSINQYWCTWMSETLFPVQSA